MTFNDFLEAVLLRKRFYHTERYGQAFFNVLSDIRPDISETIRGTDYDPFYHNDVDYKIHNYVAERWDRDSAA